MDSTFKTCPKCGRTDVHCEATECYSCGAFVGSVSTSRNTQVRSPQAKPQFVDERPKAFLESQFSSPSIEKLLEELIEKQNVTTAWIRIAVTFLGLHIMFRLVFGSGIF